MYDPAIMELAKILVKEKLERAQQERLAVQKWRTSAHAFGLRTLLQNMNRPETKQATTANPLQEA